MPTWEVSYTNAEGQTITEDVDADFPVIDATKVLHLVTAPGEQTAWLAPLTAVLRARKKP